MRKLKIPFTLCTARQLCVWLLWFPRAVLGDEAGATPLSLQRGPGGGGLPRREEIMQVNTEECAVRLRHKRQASLFTPLWGCFPGEWGPGAVAVWRCMGERAGTAPILSHLAGARQQHRRCAQSQSPGGRVPRGGGRSPGPRAQLPSVPKDTDFAFVTRWFWESR